MSRPIVKSCTKRSLTQKPSDGMQLAKPDEVFGVVEFQATADGSSTLYLPLLDEYYHSVHGALTESMHVFINAGLLTLETDEISVLEVGMGTGLNVLLTILSRRPGQKIRYHAIEKYPIPVELSSKLACRDDNERRILDKIHALPWEKPQNLDENFELLKTCADIHTAELQRYDLVYFDAFAPEKQPDMWSPSVFRKIYEAMNGGGVLVTYCSKGSAKQTMRDAGFCVKRLAGPPHKHHMVRATKNGLFCDGDLEK